MTRNLAEPVATYLAVTLLVPLLRGGYARSEFWHHAAVVAGVVALFCAASRLARSNMRADR
jgi:hypothetical protein